MTLRFVSLWPFRQTVPPSVSFRAGKSQVPVDFSACTHDATTPAFLFNLCWGDAVRCEAVRGEAVRGGAGAWT